jgi:hypothetical protein
VRRWYDEGLTVDNTWCWRMIKALIPLYRNITLVEARDGEILSFWHDR